MKQKVIGFAYVVLLMAAPHMSLGQYFQSLFDNDSTIDWGWCMHNRPNGTYFIVGWSQYGSTGHYSVFDMIISNDGSHLLSEHNFMNNRAIYANGITGQMTDLSNGEYILPFRQSWPDSATGYFYTAAGIMKLDSLGDTVFCKTYTDTSVHYDVLNAIGVMPDGGYIAGGGRGLNTPSNYLAYIIRTDSIGDTIWTHTYQKDTAQWADINNVIPLPDGRIVAAAISGYTAWDPTFSISYEHNTPWFLVLDSMGNVLKDTLYGSKFMIGRLGTVGELYNDVNGGYVLIGSYDSIYTTLPADFYENQNFPGYVAHLDTNFRITWVISFPYSDLEGHRQGALVKQLRDSSYLIVGDAASNISSVKGFAAKINRQGTIVWSRNFYSDLAHDDYFTDAVEMPDGNLVFTGTAFNDTMPAWHTLQDMWLVGTDSNGCVMDGCLTTTKITSPGLPQGKEVMRVYPNPASQVLNFQYSQQPNVTIKISDVIGRVMDEQTLQNSTGSSFNVAGYTPGIYLYQVIMDGKTQSGKVVIGK